MKRYGHTFMISPSIFTTNFICLCLASLLFFSSYHLLTPVFPAYLQMQHVSGMMLGTIVSAFMVASMVMRPWIGKLNDEMSCKRLILIGAALFAGCALLYGYVSQPMAWLALRIVHGIAFALFYTSSSVYLTCILPAQNKAEGIGHYGNAIKLAMAFSPALGVWFLQHQAFKPVFVLSCCLSLAAFCSVLFMGEPAETAGTSPTKSLGRWFHPKALFPGMIMGTNSLAFGALIPFIPLLTHEKHLSHTSWFYTVFAVCLICTRGITGQYSDRFGRRWVVVPGMALVTLSMLLLSWSPDTRIFLLGAALYGLGTGTVQPSLMAITADRTGQAERGSAMATFTLLNDSGIAIGSFAMGAFGATLGYGTTLLMLSLLVFLGCMTFFLTTADTLKAEAA